MSLGFEIKLDWIDEGDQPLEQGHVRRVNGVGVAGRLVSELHHSGEGIALAAGREVRAYVRFEQAGDDAAKGEDLLFSAGLVGGARCRFPAKSEDVNEHSVLPARHGFFDRITGANADRRRCKGFAPPIAKCNDCARRRDAKG
jgi:hypothetical protein